MTKVDVRKELAEFYPTGKKAMTPHLAVVPSGLFLMVDGYGNPNTSERFQEVTGWLYAVAYAAKFASKANGTDYSVMPMEGVWWADDNAVFTEGRKDEWKWTLMLRHPDFVTEQMLKDAIATAVSKGKLTTEQAAELRVETFAEGLSVQVLHVGPYEAEAPVITAMHEWAASEGYKLRDRHHEIYLGDPRKAAPDKLKTVLRHPVEKA